MAPSNGTTSTPPPQSWPPSPTIAHYNGIQQWHHVHPANVGRPAHYNGTPRCHPAMAPRPLHPAMAPWCHVQSAKVVRRLLLEVRTPIAIAILGKTCGIFLGINGQKNTKKVLFESPKLSSFLLPSIDLSLFTLVITSVCHFCSHTVYKYITWIK